MRISRMLPLRNEIDLHHEQVNVAITLRHAIDLLVEKPHPIALSLFSLYILTREAGKSIVTQKALFIGVCLFSTRPGIRFMGYLFFSLQIPPFGFVAGLFLRCIA